jgi:hypothetical protein
MLLNSSLFAARKNQVSQAINAIQSQIAQLQQQLADQQTFLQEIGSAEQAGESALTQIDTFLTMVRAIDPDAETVFWQAADSRRHEVAGTIAPSTPTTEKAEETSPKTTPIDPIAPTTDDTAIDVDATELPQDGSTATDSPTADTPIDASIDAPTDTDPIDTNNQGGDATKPAFLTSAELDLVSWITLRDICNDRQIKDPLGRRLTRKFAAKALLGKVTHADIAAKQPPATSNSF